MGNIFYLNRLSITKLGVHLCETPHELLSQASIPQAQRLIIPVFLEDFLDIRTVLELDEEIPIELRVLVKDIPTQMHMTATTALSGRKQERLQPQGLKRVENRRHRLIESALRNDWCGHFQNAVIIMKYPRPEPVLYENNLLISLNYTSAWLRENFTMGQFRELICGILHILLGNEKLGILIRHLRGCRGFEPPGPLGSLGGCGREKDQ
jgi:hypothetical protein